MKSPGRGKRTGSSRRNIRFNPMERAHPGGENRLLVGNVEVFALTDGEQPYPFTLDQLFPTVPAEAWAPFHQRYPQAFAESDRWHNHCGGYLLRSQGRTILVDTGKGSRVSNPGFVHSLGGGNDGRLLETLKSIGVSPKQIHIVFFTHLHPEQVGWNVNRKSPNPRATFPWARYMVNRADWEMFSRPDIQRLFPSRYWKDTLGPLEYLGVLDIIEGEQALTSEVIAIPTPGHTPGHMSIAIASEGQRAYVIGDLAIHPAQVTETEWSDSWTMDSTQAGEIRKRLFTRAAAENAMLLAGRFPCPGFGRLVREEGRLYWRDL